MNQVAQAAQILNAGGIVIFPTETVYGIGCLLKYSSAIKRLYKIKNRRSSKPTLVLVKDFSQAKSLVSFNETAGKLAKIFWPGPLTLCLPIRQEVPTAVLGSGKTLGLRVSSNKFITELFELIDQPLLAPSANLQDHQAPTKHIEIDKKLASLVDYVVNIEPEARKPSTIVTFAGDQYNVLREGEISRLDIEESLIKE